MLPFHRTADVLEFAVFRRRDAGYWQGIAGGGEDDETPLEAARREAREEAGIPAGARFLALDASCKIPVEQVVGSLLWGEEVLVIPEYGFGVEASGRDLLLSREHVESRWAPYDVARSLLLWDSNKIALWELNHRLSREPHG